MKGKKYLCNIILTEMMHLINNPKKFNLEIDDLALKP